MNRTETSSFYRAQMSRLAPTLVPHEDKDRCSLKNVMFNIKTMGSVWNFGYDYKDLMCFQPAKEMACL
jgi:hypothetical protein